MRRSWLTSGIVGLILLGLAHAWIGHDLIHGHGHGQDLGSIVYSTDAPRAEVNLLFQVFHVALFVDFFEVPQAKLEIVDKPTKAVDDDVGLRVFYLAVSRFVPRPPPHSLLIA